MDPLGKGIPYWLKDFFFKKKASTSYQGVTWNAGVTARPTPLAFGPRRVGLPLVGWTWPGATLGSILTTASNSEWFFLFSSC